MSQFRLVYREFERVEFDPEKSARVLAQRGLTLSYAGRIFPGYVLERPDLRGYSEERFLAIGAVLGNVIVVAYTPRGPACRIITAWPASTRYRELWYEQQSH